MSRVYLQIFYWTATIARYLFILLFIFVLGVIILRMVTNGYVIHDVPVKLKSVGALPKVVSNSNIVTLNAIPGGEAVLKLNIRMTPVNAVIIFVAFSTYAVLFLTILKKLRLLFSSLLNNEFFESVNIRRLRLISYCLAGISAINFITSLFHNYLLKNYFDQAQNGYITKIDLGTITLTLAMAVFILSAIFKQGNELKTENESIV